MDQTERRFDRTSTADEVLAGIDLTGTTVMVTGASSGIGVETVRAMAAHGATVIATARQMQKGADVIARLRESTGNPNLFLIELELGSLAGIRACASYVLDRWPRIDILFCNAGVAYAPFMKTQDGFELHFGSNHLGHFLLINLLMPALRAAAPSRVVITSSNFHRWTPVLFDDPNFETTPYDPNLGYSQSKTANNLCALEFNRRFEPSGVRVFSAHPGAIPTEAGRHLQGGVAPEDRPGVMRESLELRGSVFVKTVPQGAATQCWAATAAELDAHGGAYLEDCQVAAVNDSPTDFFGVKSYSINPENAARLWKISEKLLGL